MMNTTVYVTVGTLLSTIVAGNVCEAPTSFEEFGLPLENIPYSGELKFFGNGITGGSTTISGLLDITFPNNNQNGTRAEITLQDMDLSDFFIIKDSLLYNNIEVDNTNVDCEDCSFNSRLPPVEIPICPFKINLLQILEGDDTDPSSLAVKFIGRSISDSVVLEFNKSEGALVSGESPPNKIVSFFQSINNKGYRQAINSLSSFNLLGSELQLALTATYELFAAEGRSIGSNVVVFVTDGFDFGAVNPAEVNQAMNQLKTISGLKFIIVAVAGDEAEFRKLLGCTPTGTCSDLIVLPDVSRKSAQQAALLAAEKICFPTKSKEEFEAIKNKTATLLTFGVNDKSDLTPSSLQSIATSLISKTAEEYNLPEKNFEILEVKAKPTTRQLSSRGANENTLINPQGIVKIGMISENKNVDSQGIAQSLGQKLNEKSSTFANSLKKHTGAQVFLQNFEVREISSSLNNQSVRNTLTDVFDINDLLNHGNILDLNLF